MPELPGIPLNISTGSGVTSVTLTLVYNSSLLSISGVTPGAGLAGANLVLDPHSTPGNAIIDFTSPTSLASGVVDLGTLQATVPASALASYRSKADLHFTSVQIDGGALQGVGDDAVEVNAYLGDTSGDGVYSPLDAALISRVATTLDSGFAAFDKLDPAIIGDISGTGSVSSTDITLMNQEVAGINVGNRIPPIGPTPLPGGADPDLSVPITLAATPGATVVVPVNIDTAKPDGSTGMIEATLALTYDPRVFTVAPADVALGTLTDGGGWQLTSVVNPNTGEIAIDLFSTTPIQTTLGGSLVNIAMHVRDTAPAGATGLNLVNQVDPTGQHVYRTEAADGQGALVLHTVVTSAGVEPGAPGQVMVTSQTSASVVPLGAADGAAAASQSDPAAPLDAKTASAGAVASSLPLSLVEQVFTDFEQTMQVLQDNTLGQPAPLLNADLGELNGAGNCSLPLSGRLAAGDGQWEECLATLGKAAVRGRVLSAGELPGVTSLGDEEAADLSGLQAFFARVGDK